MSKQYPKIRSQVNRQIANAKQRSIVENRPYYDCVNINGPVDNSGCADTNSLCRCPCTGGFDGVITDEKGNVTNGPLMSSAVPLFREPRDEEMEWAKSQVGGCFGEYDKDGFYVLDPESVESSCGVTCHGKDYYSTFRALRTYSTFWDTPKEVPLYRNALVNLYTAQQAVCIVPGNLNLRVGEFINIPSDGSALSEDYSGCWMISNIRHAIASLQNYKMILTLIRDSKIDEPQ